MRQRLLLLPQVPPQVEQRREVGALVRDPSLLLRGMAWMEPVAPDVIVRPASDGGWIVASGSLRRTKAGEPSLAEMTTKAIQMVPL